MNINAKTDMIPNHKYDENEGLKNGKRRKTNKKRLGVRHSGFPSHH